MRLRRPRTDSHRIVTEVEWWYGKPYAGCSCSCGWWASGFIDPIDGPPSAIRDHLASIQGKEKAA